ncbi:MAG: PH domain-containing protein [Streptosporangiales bacterium]|nr:PH domain-containing protein [Streptosporangiales bacterium]
MRLVTPGDSTPASVNRYLLPSESQTQVITVRRHPAVLLRPFAIVFGGLVVAGLLTNTVAQGRGTMLTVVWWAWIAVVVWFVWRVAEWAVEYVVITSQRLLMATGLVTRKVAMMPLSKVTDMSFQRSVLGRMLGYGEFILESAGQDQALRNITYIPYPEALYIEVCGMLFPSPSRGGNDD